MVAGFPASELVASLYGKPRKYRNQPVVVDGVRFDSKRDSRRWCELKLLERAGQITALSRQVTFPLTVNGMLVCSFRADFVYYDEKGRKVIEDAKGVRTKDYIIKAKLMRAVHGLEVIEV